MMWAFVDYENIGTLESVDLTLYSKAVIFLGAKQQKIDFGNSRYQQPINMVIVQVEEVGANNLDFHLSYYLGKCETKVAKDVGFDIISNDNGFAPLIEHIRSNGRACNQIKTLCQELSVEKFITVLCAKPIGQRPKKVETLRNHIAAQMSLKGNELAIQNHINQLVNKKVIAIEDSALKYLC